MSIYSRKTLLSAVTLFVMLAILNLGIGFNTFAATESAKKYSGEEIFGGLYFGQGEVAQLFPEIYMSYYAISASKGNEFAEVKDSMISEIKTKDPDFFNRFGEEMQSGDHIRIQAALADGTKQLREAENSKFINNINKFYNDGKDLDTTTDVMLETALFVGLYVPVILANIPPTDPKEPNSLQKDELTAAVASRLDATLANY